MRPSPWLMQENRKFRESCYARRWRWRTLFLLVLFLTHPARKSPREAARRPSKWKRNVKHAFSTTVPFIVSFSRPVTSVIKRIPIIICDKRRCARARNMRFRWHHSDKNKSRHDNVRLAEIRWQKFTRDTLIVAWASRDYSKLCFCISRNVSRSLLAIS